MENYFWEPQGQGNLHWESSGDMENRFGKASKTLVSTDPGDRETVLGELWDQGILLWDSSGDMENRSERALGIGKLHWETSGNRETVLGELWGWGKQPWESSPPSVVPSTVRMRMEMLGSILESPGSSKEAPGQLQGSSRAARRLTTCRWVWNTRWIPARHRGAGTRASPPHWNRFLWGPTWPWLILRAGGTHIRELPLFPNPALSLGGFTYQNPPA